MPIAILKISIQFLIEDSFATPTPLQPSRLSNNNSLINKNNKTQTCFYSAPNNFRLEQSKAANRRIMLQFNFFNPPTLSLSLSSLLDVHLSVNEGFVVVWGRGGAVGQSKKQIENK